MKELEYDSLNKHLLPDRPWADVTDHLATVQAHYKSRLLGGYASPDYTLGYNRLSLYHRHIEGRTYVPRSYWDHATEFVRRQNPNVAKFQERSPELHAAVNATNLPCISGAVVAEHLDRSIRGQAEEEE